MTFNVLVSGNVAANNYLNPNQAKVSSGAEVLLKLGNGVFHSDTKVDVGTNMSLRQTFGAEVPLKHSCYRRDWGVGLDFTIKGGAAVDLIPYSAGKSDKAIEAHNNIFGEAKDTRVLTGELGAGLELIVSSPDTKKGFVQFGAGADVGGKYHTLLDKASNESLPEGSPLNKPNLYVNPYAEVSFYPGRSNVNFGAKVGLHESNITVGYCF